VRLGVPPVLPVWRSSDHLLSVVNHDKAVEAKGETQERKEKKARSASAP